MNCIRIYHPSQFRTLPQISHGMSFIKFSEVLVENSDLVRLQDVQLTYDFSRTDHPKLPMEQLRVYLYANNLGLIWKANHSRIDPDFISGIPNPRTLALGLKASF